MISKFSLVASIPHQMVRFYTPGGVSTVHSDPALVIEYLIEEQKRAKDVRQLPTPDTMQIGVIVDLL